MSIVYVYDNGYQFTGRKVLFVECEERNGDLERLMALLPDPGDEPSGIVFIAHDACVLDWMGGFKPMTPEEFVSHHDGCYPFIHGYDETTPDPREARGREIIKFARRVAPDACRRILGT